MSAVLCESDFFDITRYACNQHSALRHYFADEGHPVKGRYLEFLSNLGAVPWLHPIIAKVKTSDVWDSQSLLEATNLLIAEIDARYPPPIDAKLLVRDQALALLDEGLSKSAVARELGVSRRTLGRYLSSKDIAPEASEGGQVEEWGDGMGSHDALPGTSVEAAFQPVAGGPVS